MIFLKRSYQGYGDDAVWVPPTDKPWATVFDPAFYQQSRPAELVGLSPDDLFTHFTTIGIRRGACARFDWCVQTYVMNYPDLSKAMADPNWWNGDWSMALNHWFTVGMAQGRTGASIGMCPDGLYNDGNGGCRPTPPFAPLIAPVDQGAILMEPPEVTAAHAAAAAQAAAEAAARAIPASTPASGVLVTTTDTPITVTVDPVTGAPVGIAASAPVTMGPVVPQGSAVIGQTWKRNLMLAGAAAALYHFFKK